MLLNFIVDSKKISLNVNSDKPLNKILMDDLGNTSINSSCNNANCGNCVVLLNNQAVLSCITPAFKLNGATVQTFETYKATRFYRDIQKAYTEVGRSPCPRCYASKTLIIESILRSLISIKTKEKIKRDSLEEKDKQFIYNELSLNSCHCIETQQLIKIVEKALLYRGKHRVRKS